MSEPQSKTPLTDQYGGAVGEWKVDEPGATFSKLEFMDLEPDAQWLKGMISAAKKKQGLFALIPEAQRLADIERYEAQLRRVQNTLADLSPLEEAIRDR